MLSEPPRTLCYVKFPVAIYMFKVNNRSTRARCEICSKLTIKTPERRHGVILVSLSLTWNIFHALFVLVFLLIILNMKLPVEILSGKIWDTFYGRVESLVYLVLL